MINSIFIIVLVFILSVKATTIQNENDLIKKLSEGIDDTLTINSDITISKNITLSTSLNKLSIIGNSSTSKLTFNYPFRFNDNIEEIELKNVEVKGTLVFHNNKRVTFDNVVFNGNIDTEMNDYINEYIKFNNLTYRPIENKSFNHCINIKGNVEIYNSKLYGSSTCQDRILNFDGLKKYYLNIRNSYFSGEYQCSCISITQSKKANIYYTNFEKGFSKKGLEGG